MRPAQRRSLLVTIALLCVLCGAAPACAATQTAQVNASIIKPLILTWIQDLDLGTITLGPGTWSGASVGISSNGVFSCTNANVTCTGATQRAEYNVSGTNKSIVNISAPNVTLTNQSDPTKTLTMIVDSPGSVVLTNSGPPGSNFYLGGTISVNSTTPAGVYVGTFNVTVNY